MTSKPERVFRNRPLTVEEAARDNEVRHAVEAEFPPAPRESRSESLGEALRKAIRDSTQPAAEIAEKAHLSPLALSKFLAGERDIHLETADRLAEALGIKLATSRPNISDLKQALDAV